MPDVKRILEIFRDGRAKRSSLNVPLQDGEQGNLQTLQAMGDLVIADRLQPDLRTFVLREIVGDVAGHDYAGELDAVFDFCQHRIVYRKDPFGVERVADIWSTMYALNPKQPEGDCGIKSTFFATCAALIGHKPFFVVIKQDARQPNFNHVYNGVVVAGEVKYYDATPEDKPAGWQAPAEVKKIYQIFE
jgi:hypothetical protein